MHERRHAKTSCHEHIIGGLLGLERIAERAHHTNGVPSFQSGKFCGALAYHGEHEADFVAVGFANAERTRHQLAWIVGIYVNELCRLCMAGDVFVTERQTVHAVSQFLIVNDLDFMPAREKACRSRFGNGRNERCCGGHELPLCYVRWFGGCFSFRLNSWPVGRLRQDRTQIVTHIFGCLTG